MHVRVRMVSKPECIIVVDSKLTKIERFREIIKDKFDVHPKLQRLFYGGKLLEDGYNFHDYNIKLNDVIQLMVKVPQENTNIKDNKTPEKEDKKEIVLCFNENEIIYKDAYSTLYEVGDLIDVKDTVYGAWFEGEIVRIVLDPKLNYETEETKPSNEKNMSNNKSIKLYFPMAEKGKNFLKKDCVKIQDDNILYKLLVDYDRVENMVMYCNVNEIRPRARTVIDVKDLKVGQTVMVNYDIESPSDTGFWYDLKIDKIQKRRSNYELIGTLYVAHDSEPQNNTKVHVRDKIFAIEKPVPLAERSKGYKKLMKIRLPERTKPPSCYQCYDNPESTCRECGCYQCSLKTRPSKIILCDECNRGYHISCLSPPLTAIPEDDWYCPQCKRDPNEVVAPGGAKQTKKTNVSKTNRDWGRGMACVGKTKTCAMPANHFGPIPGIDVGMRWRFRIQLSESGVHRPPVSGIHGRDCEGAYSVVLSGGYEDDVDHGFEFTYTGSGGRDLSGNRRTAEQSSDQKLTRENKALARNCAIKEVCEDGGDAGEHWTQGKPVRVVRSYKMLKHFPKYAPKEGLRYDGIYKVVKYYPEKGLSGYRVWKYLLRRDDPNPAPWEKGAKLFPIVYPDGYLEAEAEKKAQKNKKGKGSKKRIAADSEQTSSSSDTTPPNKKRKLKNNDEPGTSKGTENSKTIVLRMFTKNQKKDTVINVYDKIAIESDTVNTKLWAECLEVIEKQGKKEFIERVTQVFLCIICQELVVKPFTTPCLHNFCMACIKLAFKSTQSKACPCCRQSLEDVEILPNENLKTALRCILPGYDAGKK